MWTKATTEEDAILMMDTGQACEPLWYNASDGPTTGKGVRAKKLREMVSSFTNTDLQYWIYQDGDACAFLKVTKRVGETARIERCCATGFAPDVFNNYLAAFPIIMDKIREVMDAWEVFSFKSITPRTLNGECQIWFVQTYAWEATSVLYDEDTGWLTEYDRSGEKPVDESNYKVITPSRVTVAADAVPAGYSPETLRP